MARISKLPVLGEQTQVKYENKPELNGSAVEGYQRGPLIVIDTSVEEEDIIATVWHEGGHRLLEKSSLRNIEDFKPYEEAVVELFAQWIHELGSKKIFERIYMKAASAKQKGQRLAKLVRDKFLKAFKLHPDDIRVTPSGVNGEDLNLSPLARKSIPYSIECKNVEKLNIWEAIRQAESANREYPGLLIFKRNKCDPYVALKLDEFIELLKK